MAKSYSNYFLLALATIFAVIALLFAAISFATDNWVITNVDRDALVVEAQNSRALGNNINSNPAYTSRKRGLFRTCYNGDEASFLDTYVPEDDITDGNCLKEKGYEIDNDEKQVKNDEDYDTRIHLMRCHLAFYIIGLLVLIVAIICGCIGCWSYGHFALRVAAVCCLIAVLSIAAGIAFFHGYEYLENEQINVEGFPRHDLTQDPILEKNTDREYGYSYILGWLAVGFSLVATILFFCTAWNIHTEQGFRDSNRVKGYQTTTEVIVQPSSVLGGYSTAQPTFIAQQPAYVAPQPAFAMQQPVAAAQPVYGAQPMYGVF